MARDVLTLIRVLARALSRERSGPQLAEVSAALRGLGSPPDEQPPAEEPVFVLATGWRSGSTLLQRILCTDRRLLLWGEPFGRMALLPRLVEMVSGVSAGWPPPSYYIDRRPDEPLELSWIANLFPPTEAFRAGLRALFDDWLARPARERGFTRWGFKEVRLGAAEALVLSWIYPRARFVVLTRDPRDAYRSLKASAPDWWVYARWPDQRIDCATSFARHWNRLAASWAGASQELEPVRVRYEEMVAPGFDFAGLGEAIGLELEPAGALAARIGGTAGSAGLGALERWLIVRQARVGMRAMGYLP